MLCIIIIGKNEAALKYHRVRGLYFLAVIFVATIAKLIQLPKPATQGFIFWPNNIAAYSSPFYRF